MTVLLEKLIDQIHSTARYNPDVQVAPACILWPDQDKQWQDVIPIVRESMPELLILGPYQPENMSGPAIWIRCALAGQVNGFEVSVDRPPVIYLPGISRQELRAIESCPEFMKPLAELQYRGVFWSQVSSRDWTVLAFLKSEQGGLGLDVAQDQDCKSAMISAVVPLMDEEIDSLQGRHLDKEFFNSLLAGGDYVREMLRWINSGDAYRSTKDDSQWQAFVELSKSHLKFNPDTDGIIKGAEKLAQHEREWNEVWLRYCEAPDIYRHIPDRIRQAVMPTVLLFGSYEGWPQWNDEQEKDLLDYLAAVAKLNPGEARKKIYEAEEKHGMRREYVWARIGQSPLAKLMVHLNTLAEATEKALTAGQISDLLKEYSEKGWMADDAVLRLLHHAADSEHLPLIKQLIRTLYADWLMDGSQYLQDQVEIEGYPGATVDTVNTPQYVNGDCVIFVDGLRYDIGIRLKQEILKRKLQVDSQIQWAALPSLTATGKPAVSPVAGLICGRDSNEEYDPVVKDSGQSLKGGYQLHRLLQDQGWQILKNGECGQPDGLAWYEYGDIDNDGHHHGWSLATLIDSKVQQIATQIEHLLAAGWERVHIVTDHGWLLLPDGLPKTSLPPSLTHNKWGRVAALKPGVSSIDHSYPWFWNPAEQFTLAEGSHCYIAGNEYAHGGLSLQECLTLQLTVTSEFTGKVKSGILIQMVEWKGMTCRVTLNGPISGAQIDIRKAAPQASTSVVNKLKNLETGKANVAVDDWDLEGQQAFIVVIDENGELLTQRSTIIGGGE